MWEGGRERIENRRFGRAREGVSSTFKWTCWESANNSELRVQATGLRGVCESETSVYRSHLI